VCVGKFKMKEERDFFNSKWMLDLDQTIPLVRVRVTRVKAFGSGLALSLYKGGEAQIFTAQT
jgi:hypothetical protein